jgi:hypothetical protein
MDCSGFLTYLHFARLTAFGDGSSLVPGKGFVTHCNPSLSCAGGGHPSALRMDDPFGG